MALIRAQIFVSANIDAKIHCDLLVDQCNLAIRKEWSHPPPVVEVNTKIWLTRWVNWHSIKATTHSILLSIIV